MAEIKWKTMEEIEREQNSPKPPTIEERIQATEEALIVLLLEKWHGGGT